MAKRRLISFDWAMKKLLRSKANFEILEGFLSELLRDDIRIQEVLESESNKEDSRDKFNRVDLKVRNQKDEVIVIEVQYERELDFLQRILFSTSKVITEHLQESDPYAEVVKVISVNILYFDLGHGQDYVYHGSTTFRGIHCDDILELSRYQQGAYKKKELYQIFPEYYLIKVNSFDDIAKDSLDEWIYFLKNEEIKDEFNAKGLLKAKDALDIMKLPESERLAYERYQEDLHYQASMLHSSYYFGISKGVEQGRMEGRIEGEQQKALDIARNLIDVLDDATIAEKTGLSVEEIARLRVE
ncbi:Rpn family recombination-promoting nuclease/putative transposase [Candidatus Electrothrix sp.]|uniref:Rpn family recombination-promoting nuclease/putative transposase n=1 Tax=Candidatus Electrothrix sp. TaxID=2170559 RepID=UPI004057628C